MKKGNLLFSLNATHIYYDDFIGDEIEVGYSTYTRYENVVEIRITSGDPYFAFQMATHDISTGQDSYDREKRCVSEDKALKYFTDPRVDRYAEEWSSNHRPPRYRCSSSPKRVSLSEHLDPETSGLHLVNDGLTP